MMIVVASENGRVGIGAAVEILRDGGSALDAVEAATRIVESNTADHSVGVGGYPNILGEVELDASIMEGTTRRAGAVGALRGYHHPISVARQILEALPHHLFLVGDGAARFAHERDFDPADLLTPDAEAAWRREIGKLTAGMPEHEAVIGGRQPLAELTRLATDPEKIAGTVNFIALDNGGRIASAVSTSGWSFKYPGRVGDSALIGAGNYCDDRFGACGCTGLGEWAIRAGTARSVVSALEYGRPLDEACRRAMADLRSIPLPPGIDPIMNLIAIDAAGRHAGFSTAAERIYVWQTTEMDSYEIAPRAVA
jgi:L-asparaginase / beta-aspartyl-peptidase